MIIFCLTLVRHGETSHNKHNVIQGQLDVPLSSIGLEQAQKLGVHLQHQKYTHIYSSDLIRAKCTAENILNQSQVCNVAIVEDRKLRERKFGVIEGKSFKFLKEAAKKSNQSVLHIVPHGAETVQEVQARAHTFFKELCQHMRILAANRSLTDENSTYHESVKNGATSTASTGHPQIRNKRKRQDSNDEICKNSIPEDDEHLCTFSASSEHPVLDRDEFSQVEPTFTDEDIRSRLMPCKCETEDSDCPNVSLSPLVSDTISNPQANDGPVSVNDFDIMVANVSVSNVDVSNKPTASSMSLLKTRDTDRERRISVCSSNDENESALDITGNVLVVSHGGFLKELVLYFVEKLGCSVPGGKKQAMRISPNAGLSKFTVSITETEDEVPKIICHQIHDKHHLGDLGTNIYDSSTLIAEKTAL